MGRSAARARRADRTVSSASLSDSGAQQSGSAGFQDTRGHWTSVALGPSEKALQLRGTGPVAAAITNERHRSFPLYRGILRCGPDAERARGFGGWRAKRAGRPDLSRTLVLKSQSTGWTEVR